MNILFVLGNGFDLQLGLPTRYSDFYKYYVRLESKSEAVKKLKDAIKDKPQEWSDLETALGEFTSQTKSADEFCEAYDDLQIALRDYILTVDEMMQSDKLDVNTDVETLRYGFSVPEKLLDSGAAYTIEGEFSKIIVSDNYNSIRNINLISFNYTHVVEKYIDGNDSLIGENTYLRSVLHAHKEVSNNQSIWVGVDNQEQIHNLSIRDNEDILYRLIKPMIISSSNRRMVNDTKRIIKKADVIVIFGASLGPSDMSWAKLIAEKIENGAVVILFVHNENSYLTDNTKLIDQIKYKSNFVAKMNEYGANIKDSSNIFVEINSPIFTNGTPNKHDKNLGLVLNKLKFRELTSWS